MAKNKTKQAKFKPVTFIVQKSEFKAALDNVVKSIGNFKNEFSTLNGINTHIESDCMEMTATDGYTILKAYVGLDEPIKGKCDILLSGLHLSKMKLTKGYKSKKKGISILENLEFTINEQNASIKDVTNGVTYTIPKIIGQYPDIEQFLKQKKNKNTFEIALNPVFLERFKNTPKYKNAPIVFVFDKTNPLANVLIKTEWEEDQTKRYEGLIMPMQMRNNRTDEGKEATCAAK